MRAERPIVHIVPSEPWGGIQALIPVLAREQMRQGSDVRLVCLGRGRRIRALARQHGLDAVSRSLSGLTAPVRLLAIMLGARGAIIHTHCEPIWATSVIALAARGRWIAHAHVYPGDADGVQSWKSRLGRWLHRRLATRHIAITHSVGRALLASGIATPATLDVVHNGVEIPPAPPPRPSTAPFTLGFVGRVVAEKGIFDFIDLAARLADDPAIAFSVYGDGADFAAARALAAERGVAERIVFHGYVDDMASAWSTLDMAAVFSHREPFGLVFLEAALSGVPTLSHENESGGCEVAHFLRTAHRVGDLAQAADLVRAKLGDPTGSSAALAQDRAIIAERFSIGRMAQGVAAAYRRLDTDAVEAPPS